MTGLEKTKKTHKLANKKNRLQPHQELDDDVTVDIDDFDLLVNNSGLIKEPSLNLTRNASCGKTFKRKTETQKEYDSYDSDPDANFNEYLIKVVKERKKKEQRKLQRNLQKKLRRKLQKKSAFNGEKLNVPNSISCANVKKCAFCPGPPIFRCSKCEYVICADFICKAHHDISCKSYGVMKNIYVDED